MTMNRKVIHSLTQKATKAGFGQAAAKATGTRRRLERVVEDSVARALKRFGVPTRKGVDTLSKRIAALSALIGTITAGVSRQRAAAKSAASGSRTAARRAPAG
jgi:Poly(hydroxyalcanoate) granule associated protein (phasin)